MKALIKRLDRLSSKLCRLQYKFSCHICQREGTDAHHIVSRNHKRVRWDQFNLVYLCRDCHLKAHSENMTFGRDINQTVYIWSLPELKELEKELKLKIKELK